MPTVRSRGPTVQPLCAHCVLPLCDYCMPTVPPWTHCALAMCDTVCARCAPPWQKHLARAHNLSGFPFSQMGGWRCDLGDQTREKLVPQEKGGCYICASWWQGVRDTFGLQSKTGQSSDPAPSSEPLVPWPRHLAPLGLRCCICERGTTYDLQDVVRGCGRVGLQQWPSTWSWINVSSLPQQLCPLRVPQPSLHAQENAPLHPPKTAALKSGCLSWGFSRDLQPQHDRHRPLTAALGQLPPGCATPPGPQPLPSACCRHFRGQRGSQPAEQLPGRGDPHLFPARRDSPETQRPQGQRAQAMEEGTVSSWLRPRPQQEHRPVFGAVGLGLQEPEECQRLAFPGTGSGTKK